MDSEELKLIDKVYSYLLRKENEEWTESDENLSMLTYLDDDQIAREASVVFAHHKTGRWYSGFGMNKSEFDSLSILEAVGLILQFYEKFGIMPSSYRYVLEWYINAGHQYKLNLENRD